MFNKNVWRASNVLKRFGAGTFKLSAVGVGMLVEGVTDMPVYIKFYWRPHLSAMSLNDRCQSVLIYWFLPLLNIGLPSLSTLAHTGHAT